MTGTTYTVVSGDTGDKIAAKLGISFQQLEAVNPKVDWNALKVGETLQVPSASTTGDSDPGTSGSTTIHQYSGPAPNFPDPSKWQKFSLMWADDSKLMLEAKNDTAEQISYLEKAINTVAEESGIDRRAILCTIMQESGGNVHVKTTVSPPPGSIRNPGLMQSDNGVEFSESDPAGSILQMIRDGTEGTKYGDGLKQCLAKSGNYYEAFRLYNSGELDKKDLSDAFGATTSYVQDMANRLMGAQPN